MVDRSMPLKQWPAEDVEAEVLQGSRNRVKAKLLESHLPTGAITAPIDTTPEVDVGLDCVFTL